MTDHIFKNTKNIALSPEEKEGGRTALRAFIAANPVREAVLVRHIFQKDQRSIFQHVYKTMPIVLLIALLLGGGAAAYADTSLPGDALYPVKVNVNEEVRGWFAVSDEAEARLQAGLAERRLEEAEKLASEGRLNAEASTDIETRFKAQSDEVRVRVNILKENGETESEALEISSDFEARLRAHAGILSAISAGNPGSGIAASGIVLAVDDETSTMAGVKAEAESTFAASTEADSKVRGAAEALRKNAERKIAEVRKFLSNPPTTAASAETYVEAEAKIKLAEKLLAQGNEYFKLGAYRKAFVTFQESFAVAQRAFIILHGNSAFGVSVGSTATGGTATDPSATPQPGVTPAPMPVPKPGAASVEVEAIAKYSEASRMFAEINNFVSVRMAVTGAEIAAKVEAQLNVAGKALAEAKRYISLSVWEKANVKSDESINASQSVYALIFGEDPRPFSDNSTVQIQKITPSGEVEIEIEDADGSGKFR